MTYSLARAIAKIREGELELQQPTAPAPAQPDRSEIDPAIVLYLTEVKHPKSDKTFTGYKADLAKFRASCKKQFVDQITQADLQAAHPAQAGVEVERSRAKKIALFLCLLR